MTDWILLVATGAIAWHGLTFRDENGETEWGHLIFGAFALMFFLRTLLVEIIGLHHIL